MTLRSRLARITPTEWLLLVIQIAFVLATRLGQPAIDVDDAYTHFHIAQNLAEGRGFVFNPGEKVLGTTSPIFVMTLAGLYKITHIEIPLLARWFNMLADVALVLFALMWLRRAGMPLTMRHAIGLILTAEPLRMHYTLAGMEMSYFLLATAIIFEMAHRGRWLIAGALLGLLGWFRPEGAIVWLALAMALFFCGGRRRIVPLFGVAIATAAIMAAGLFAYFGTFIPQSIVAKGSADWYTESKFSGTLFLIRLGDLTPFFSLHGTVSSWGSFGDRVNSLILAFSQLCLMGAGAAWLWRVGQRHLALCWSLFVLGWYAFYAIANPMIIDWYYVPYFYGSLLLAGVGWLAIAQEIWKRAPAALRRWPRLAGGAALAVLLGLYWVSSSHQIERAGRACNTLREQLAFRLNEQPGTARELEYVKIAALLNGWTGEKPPTVGCTEIGIFGYYYKGPLLDFFGLISPEVLEVLKPDVLGQLPASCRIFPFAALMQFRPELVMMHPMFIPTDPPEFQAQYQRLATKYIVSIYVRRDAAKKMPIPPDLLIETTAPAPEPAQESMR